MSDIYGNQTYPESRRISSRPFACYFHKWTDEPDLNNFQEALLDMGEELIGDPFDLCCDIEHFPPRYFSPAFWNLDKVGKFADSKKFSEYSRTLGDAAQYALASICQTIKSMRADRNISNLPQLVNDFKTLWADQIILDPRVSHAEELFFHTADKNAASHYRYDRSPDRLRATLEWMRQPANAERVAKMFLYSRLSQHFGETDPRSIQFAARVHEDLQKGNGKLVMERLALQPEAYFQEAVTGKVEGKAAALKSRLVSLFSSQASAAIEKRAALTTSARSIMADHQRLLDGSWAAEQLQNLELKAGPERPALNALPSPA